MLRDAARRVVAGVADLKAVRDRAVLEFPDDPMCEQVFLVVSEFAIAAGQVGAGPRPAFGRGALLDASFDLLCQRSHAGPVYMTGYLV
jgi:hypothetical protein